MARRDHGSIDERVRSDGTIAYRARKRIGGGKSEYKTFDTRDEAERWVLDVSLNVRNGSHKSRHIASPTVTEWLDQYIDRGESRWRGSTATIYRGILDRAITPTLGKRKVVNLTPTMVQAWIDGQSDLAPNTVHLHVQVLGGAMGEAVRLGLIDHNPVASTRLPKVRRKQRVVWDRDDMRKVLAVVADDPLWCAVYRVMLSTGMRPGELRALAWADVGRDAITIRRTVTRLHGREVIGMETKGGKVRTVAVPSSVLTALKAWRLAQEDNSGLVFAAHRGGMLDTSTWTRHHRAYCKAAGVAVIRLHDLRHVAATSMLAAGVPLKVVSERLGHSGIQVTADTYLHVDTDMQMSAAERVEAWLDDTTTSSRTGTE